MLRILLPSLRSENVGVGSPDVFAALHDIHAVGDVGALSDVDGRFLIVSSADGEGGVFSRYAVVCGNRGEKAKG